jgi:formiminotetrahydrofolate cyclodeaminase
MDSAFIKALALPRPDPGGGSAAAHGAALGMALLEKVVQLEQNRQSTQPHARPPWDDFLPQVRRIAAELLALQQEDIRAYFTLTRTRAAGSAEERAAALEEAVACPGRIMRQTVEGLALLAQVGGRCRLHLVADLLVAAELLGGACRGAYYIARANLPLMAEPSRQDAWRRRLTQSLADCESWSRQVITALHGRMPCP